jgi:hypothetical protein
MLLHNTTPSGDPKNTTTEYFNRPLSLAIDAVHDELDRLSCQRGLRAWLRRWWLKRQLRHLEAHI